jgi:hypothetical protein
MYNVTLRCILNYVLIFLIINELSFVLLFYTLLSTIQTVLRSSCNEPHIFVQVKSNMNFVI